MLRIWGGVGKLERRWSRERDVGWYVGVYRKREGGVLVSGRGELH